MFVKLESAQIGPMALNVVCKSAQIGPVAQKWLRNKTFSVVFESQELFLYQLKRNTRSHWSIQHPLQVNAYIILSKMFL
jgi:hypothetical protein